MPRAGRFARCRAVPVVVRILAAVVVDTAVNSDRFSPGYGHQWTRRSLSSRTRLAALLLVPCGQIPAKPDARRRAIWSPEQHRRRR